jgi:hypothetical protein
MVSFSLFTMDNIDPIILTPDFLIANTHKTLVQQLQQKETLARLEELSQEYKREAANEQKVELRLRKRRRLDYSAYDFLTHKK